MSNNDNAGMIINDAEWERIFADLAAFINDTTVADAIARHDAIGND